MKKISFIVLIVVILFGMQACQIENQSKTEIVDVYQEMSTKQTLFFTDYDDGRMFGDAYYVQGKVDDYIKVVNYYKDEYIEIQLSFDKVDTNGVAIKKINIVYCDYIKDVYFTATATSAEPISIYTMDFEGMFEEIEDLSIQDMRDILSDLDLL